MTAPALTLTGGEVRDLLRAGVIMTRQPLDPQPPGVYSRLVWYCYGGKWGAHPPGSVSGECWSGCCPLGAAEGLVWVKEAVRRTRTEQPWATYDSLAYEADGQLFLASSWTQATWKPGQSPLGVKARISADECTIELARIWLRIDEVRVERIDGVWMWARKCIVVSTTGRPATGADQ